MKKLLIVLFLFNFNFTIAQQIPQISGFNFYNEFYNPASIGMKYELNVGTLIRKQWVGFEGSPFIIGVFGDYTFRNRVSKVGLQYNYDQLGSFKHNQIRAIYCHQFRLSRKLTMQLALSPELFFTTANFNFIANDPNDPALPPNGISKGAAFTFSSGITVFTPRFLFGFASNQILESKINVIHYQLIRHYLVTMMYQIKISDNYSLTPMAHFKTDTGSHQWDFILQNEYKNKYILGVGYRIKDAVTFQVGFKWSTFTIAYMYDLTTSEIKNYSKGSHEIFFKWGKIKWKSKGGRTIIMPNF
jgi:type IX secretion system PorP/SprF family membrane protein